MCVPGLSGGSSIGAMSELTATAGFVVSRLGEVYRRFLATVVAVAAKSATALPSSGREHL